MVKIVLSSLVCSLALIAEGDQARAQVGVAVYVNNNTAAKVKGIFQSTDFGDFSVGCVAQSGTGSSQCQDFEELQQAAEEHKKFALHRVEDEVATHTEVQQSAAGRQRLQEERYLDLVVRRRLRHQCRSQVHLSDGLGQFSSWSWTVWPTENKTNSLTVDCAIDNYSVLKK